MVYASQYAQTYGKAEACAHIDWSVWLNQAYRSSVLRSKAVVIFTNYPGSFASWFCLCISRVSEVVVASCNSNRLSTCRPRHSADTFFFFTKVNQIAIADRGIASPPRASLYDHASGWRAVVDVDMVPTVAVAVCGARFSPFTFLSSRAFLLVPIFSRSLYSVLPQRNSQPRAGCHSVPSARHRDATAERSCRRDSHRLFLAPL